MDIPIYGIYQSIVFLTRVRTMWDMKKLQIFRRLALKMTYIIGGRSAYLIRFICTKYRNRTSRENRVRSINLYTHAYNYITQ